MSFFLLSEVLIGAITAAVGLGLGEYISSKKLSKKTELPEDIDKCFQVVRKAHEIGSFTEKEKQEAYRRIVQDVLNRMPQQPEINKILCKFNERIKE